MLEKVLELIELRSVGINFRELKKFLNVSSENEQELRDVLRELELSGKIYQNEDGIYSKFPDNFFIEEVIFSSRGNPQIIHNNSWVPLNLAKMEGILPNDIVIFTKEDKKIFPVKILKRGIKEVVCEVKIKNKRKYLEVCSTRNKVIAKIDQSIMKKLEIGEKVLVEITTNLYGVSYQAKYIKRIGHKNDLDAELKAIAINNGFLTEYPSKIWEEIEAMPDEVKEEDLINRRDKRKDFIFTIDGAHTKDIDDAIELKILPNGNYLLTVSIAHVSHYVKPGSALWQFAEANTTSVYLVDRVLSMLHSKLSNGICSLNPGVDRLARSFEMEITPVGEVIRFDTYPSVIHSLKQMTYEEVNLILEHDIITPGYEPYAQNLKLMEQLSNLLTLRRKNAGAVDFPNKELSFRQTKEGKITKVVEKQGPAQKIIENFMVITNANVGKYFNDLAMPFVYRNHELPFDDLAKKAYDLLKTFGYRLEKINSTNDPLIIQKMVRSLASKEEFEVLSILILKTMQRAYYSNKSVGHFGLALDYYSQSTSPIRRFLDLVIHTLIDYYEGLEPKLPFEGKLEEYLKAACKNATIKERSSDKAEYSANQLFMAKYMVDHIGEEFYGYISQINTSSVSIKTDDLIDGYAFINFHDLGFIYYPESRMIVNKEKNIVLHIGSKLKVKVVDVDLSRQLIEFDIIEPNLYRSNTRTRKK